MTLGPGTTFGRYEIVSPLGAGGMGDVYRARDARLGREVALKVLRESLALDPERMARFEREARLLAALNHPNIAAIYGIEEAQGRSAIVLELVEGRTLQGYGPRRVREAVAIAGQIAEGLEAAHRQGIVHRDLKPANVKLRPDGAVKVLDFGLAKTLRPDPAEGALSQMATRVDAETGSGMVVGTVGYMSPEQARGQPVGEQADIWAFGCVLFELLSGRRAFSGATASDALAAVLEREPDWRALPGDTPPSVERLLRRCLAKESRLRLHHIGDARLELIDAASAGPPVSTPSRARTLALIGAGGLALGLALGLPLGSLRSAAAVRASGPTWSVAQSIATQLTNYSGESSPALSPDGRSFVYVSEQGGTPDIWLRQVSGGEPIRLTNDSAEEANLVYSPDGDSIYYDRDGGDGPSIWRIGALGGPARKVVSRGSMPSPSPDGNSLAYYEPDGEGRSLVVAALDGGPARPLARGFDGVWLRRAAWSPDGRRISFPRSGLFAATNLFVVDLGTGRERLVLQIARSTSDGGVGDHVWLPDNRHLVVAYAPFPRPLAPNDLGVVDVEDGTVSRLTITVAGWFSALSRSADGSRLIALNTRESSEVWRVPFGPDPEANGRAAVRLLDESWQPMWTYVPRDGRTLLFASPASGSRNLWTMPIDGGQPRQITTLPNDAVAHSALSPDGTRVAFVAVAAGSMEIWTQNLDGSELRQLTRDGANHAWPIWSPDGRSIGFTTWREGHWSAWRMPVDGGPPERLADGFLRGDWIAQPTGTGTWIARGSAGTGGGVELMDVERGTTLWVEPHPPSVSLPMFNADGGKISLVRPDRRDGDAIWVFDTASGRSRLAARLPFKAFFRASWVDGDKAFVVNTYRDASHVVLFDRFLISGPAAGGATH